MIQYNHSKINSIDRRIGEALLISNIEDWIAEARNLLAGVDKEQRRELENIIAEFSDIQRSLLQGRCERG